MLIIKIGINRLKIEKVCVYLFLYYVDFSNIIVMIFFVIKVKWYSIFVVYLYYFVISR